MTEIIGPQTEVTQPVNRGRRAKFVFSVVAFSLVATVAIVLFASAAPSASIAIEALMSLATFLSVAYVGASSVDYTFKKENK